MEVQHQDHELDRLESDPDEPGRWSPAIVRSYRKKMQAIRAAFDERDLRNMKSLHFEKLKPPRDHEHSIRLNDQWRLTFQIMGSGNDKKILVVAIEDYH